MTLPFFGDNVINSDYLVEGNEEVGVYQSDCRVNPCMVSDKVVDHKVPLVGVKLDLDTNALSNSLRGVLIDLETVIHIVTIVVLVRSRSLFQEYVL